MLESLDPSVQVTLIGLAGAGVGKAIDLALGAASRVRSVRDELRAEIKGLKEELRAKSEEVATEVRRRREAEDREVLLQQRCLEIRNERDDAENANRLAVAIAKDAAERLGEATEELRRREEEVKTLRAQLAKAQRQARLRALGPGDTDPDA